MDYRACRQPWDIQIKPKQLTLVSRCVCVAKDDTDWHDDDEDGEGVTRLGRSPEPAHVKQELDGHEDRIVEVNLLKKRELYY